MFEVAFTVPFIVEKLPSLYPVQEYAPESRGCGFSEGIRTLYWDRLETSIAAFQFVRPRHQ